MDRYRAETYRLRAKLPVYKRRVARSLQVIDDAIHDVPETYVSWSGGKDSTALLHLVRRVNPDIPIIHARTDIEYPDCQAFVDQLIDAWSLPVTIVAGPSAWQIMREAGGPYGQVNVASSRLDRECFFDPIAAEVKRCGYKQVIMGLRAQESRARWINRVVHGMRYYNKGRDLWTLNPLADWEGSDIFAYHIENQIPWAPIYDRTYLHPDPERIREGWWVTGETAAMHGMVEWLRYHYPELWQRAKSEWPWWGT